IVRVPGSRTQRWSACDQCDSARGSMWSVTFVHGLPALVAGTATRVNCASDRTAYWTPGACATGAPTEACTTSVPGTELPSRIRTFTSSPPSAVGVTAGDPHDQFDGMLKSEYERPKPNANCGVIPSLSKKR